MKTALHITAIALILFICVIFGARMKAEYDQTIFRAGYERGTFHALAYKDCTGRYPSMAWRKEAASFTTLDGDAPKTLSECEFVAMIQERTEKK